MRFASRILDADLQPAMQRAGDVPVVFVYVADAVIAGAGKSRADHLPNVTGVDLTSGVHPLLTTLPDPPLVPEPTALPLWSTKAIRAPTSVTVGPFSRSVSFRLWSWNGSFAHVPICASASWSSRLAAAR
jgi:hypothetical protein